MRSNRFPNALDLYGRPVWRAADIAQWIERLSQRRYKDPDA
jgi:predicted DNA-binding transcriptional regulator AlpA